MLDWLKAVLGEGYTEELDGKISGELEKGYIPKADYSAQGKELTAARAALKERDGQMEQLKTSAGDLEALHGQITALQEENRKKDEDHTAALTRLRLEGAVEKALSDAHAKNLAMGKAMLAPFLEGAELLEDGGVKGLQEEIQKLAAGADTGFLFEAAPGPRIFGASPVGGGLPPDPQSAGFESRLSEARRQNDMVAAINIKQEAAAQGVILM